MTNVISFSGGLDSTSLLLHLLAKKAGVHAVTFDYGQKHKIEIEYAKKNISYIISKGFDVQHKLIDISDCTSLLQSSLTDIKSDIPEGHYEQDNMKQTVVPNRNAIFSSIAYGYALSIANETETEISLCLGVHSGDHAIYPDCRPEFYDAIHHAFAIGNWDSERVCMYLPYLDGDKYTILKDAQESIEKLGLDFDVIFRNTNTSYDPDSEGRASGKTGADVERILAFHQLGVPDPVSYVKPWDETLQEALALKEAHETTAGT